MKKMEKNGENWRKLEKRAFDKSIKNHLHFLPGLV